MAALGRKIEINPGLFRLEQILMCKIMIFTHNPLYGTI